MYKRIAVISYHTCPLSDEDVTQTGGLNIYVLELSKSLAKKGYILDIFTRSVSNDSPKIVNVTQNLRVIHLPAGNIHLPKKELLKCIPEFQKNFFDFMKEGNLTYDFVYCHYYLSGLVGLEIKKLLKIPLIINFHTLALMKNLVAKSEDGGENTQRIKSEILLLEKADKVIATSKTDAQYISSLYEYPPEKVFVLTPGVDLELFKPEKRKRNNKNILFVGRIEPLKGIDVLLYSLKILNINTSLTIVGSGNKEIKRLKEIIKILKIRIPVHFVGKKTQRELPDYYNSADIVVIPSQYESFGIAVLEAMACGVPVITTDVSGISTLFDEDHPLITSASNPILLSEKIEYLLTDKEEYLKLKKEVLNKAKNLSWDTVAEKFEKIMVK